MYEHISWQKATDICARTHSVIKQSRFKQYFKLGQGTEWYHTNNLPSDYFIEVHQKNTNEDRCLHMHGFDNSYGVHTKLEIVKI